MSSPIHLDEDIDTGLIYAPPRARDRIPSRARSTLRSPKRSVAAAEMSLKKLKPKFRGDRAMLALQRQLELDPGLIPEPASEDAAVLGPLLTRVCSVSALAALAAWGLVSYSNLRKNVESVPAAGSTTAIASNRGNLADVPSSRLRPAISRTTETLAATGKPQPVGLMAPAAEAVASPSISVTTAASPSTAVTPRASPQDAVNHPQLGLDSEEIDVLIKRGKDLLADGDVAAARLLLRRAAEAGSAEGAFALGTTFDPILLARFGAIGAAPDRAQARQWYRRAAELGSSAASQQLAGLGDAR